MAQRVLEVDLRRGNADAAVSWRRRAWAAADPGLAFVGSWGGSALGLALLARAADERPEEAPLVFAVGECVRRGVPTAARVSILSRSPLTGLLAEGQVGGPTGRALSRCTDALVLRGRTSVPGAVLVVREESVELTSSPELSGLSPEEVGAVLAQAHPEAGAVCVGLAGERELPFASLATAEARPSFVGRGGLGAVFGALGLKALVIDTGSDRSRVEADALELVQLLTRSPRLAERARGGTFELFGAFSARGDLRARNYRERVPAETARALHDEVDRRAAERKGCEGCPTPCGWVFERSDGSRQAARFSASYALGSNLGLDRLDDALSLLAVCDRLGIDAKEAGALLSLACVAQEKDLLPGPPDWGSRDRLQARLESLVSDDASPFSLGARAAARELGLEEELPLSRGQAARPEASFASILGQCVSSGGSDPMRSFPFLIEAAGAEGLEALCRDLGPLPPEAADPGSPVAKGRLVYWHENLVAAVDTSGFCAFSTAGLLADGVLDLDQLAERILPEALREPPDETNPPGRRLLAAGASVCLLRRELDRGYGATLERPAWARERLGQPGMLDEYRHWRGLDAEGHPRADVLARMGTAAVLADPVGAPEEGRVLEKAQHPSSVGAQRLGAVSLRALGPLGERLGGQGARQEPQARVALPLPATVREVLRGAVRADDSLARDLFHGEEPLPAVWREGRRLRPDEEVRDGDVLDLVTAIAGG